MYERILIPLDGSERAQSILVHLGPFLKWTNAKITLLAAIGRPQYTSPDTLEELGYARRQAQRYLNSVRSRMRDKGLDADIEVRTGTASECILDAAVELGVDLVAIASHGHGGLTRLYVGSTAERVLRASACEVLLVKSAEAVDQPADQTVPLPAGSASWTDVLVPLDGSMNAEAAIPRAARLAGLSDATVHLLRVVPAVPSAGYYVPAEAAVNDTSAVDTYLDNLAGGLRATGLKVRTQVAQGHAVTTITDYAQRQDVGLVVMTTHGRTGLQRWLLGSVAESILRAMHIPILLRRITNDVK